MNLCCEKRWERVPGLALEREISDETQEPLNQLAGLTNDAETLPACGLLRAGGRFNVIRRELDDRGY
jgi:hypothetical protein